MKTVNVHEAKTHLSRLLALVLAGEEIIMASPAPVPVWCRCAAAGGEEKNAGHCQGSGHRLFLNRCWHEKNDPAVLDTHIFLWWLFDDSRHVGIRALLIHALNEQAKAFYLGHGRPLNL